MEDAPDECSRSYLGCSVLGLAASWARLAINSSYSGVPRRGGASAGRPPIQCGMSAICSPGVRPPAHDNSDSTKAEESRFDLQPSSHNQPPVSPYRRDCRSAAQAPDARDLPCLFRESLRARFWSPFRRTTAVPPDDTLALCNTKTRPSCSRQSNHRSPFSLW